MKSSKLVALIGAIGVCLAAGAVNAETKTARIEAKRMEAERAAAKQAAFDAALPARMALVQSVISQYAPQILSDAQYGAGRLSQFAMQVHQTPSSVLESARTRPNCGRLRGDGRTCGGYHAQSGAGRPGQSRLPGDRTLPYRGLPVCDGGCLGEQRGAGLPQFQRYWTRRNRPLQPVGSPGIATGTPGAIALNLTVTGATHQGFVAVRPVGSTALSSAINFLANQDIANALVVKMTGGGINDFEAVPGLNGPGTAAVHVIFDLLGFYVASEPAALECVDTASTAGTTGTNPAGETGASAPACAAGFTAVSMNCLESPDALLVDSSVEFNFCAYVPRAATASAFSVGQRCCRVPGNNAGRF